MDKPDWKGAPDWAQWLAMDRSGVWCWFVGEPYCGSSVWLPDNQENGDGDTFDYIDGMTNDYPIDWIETLEPRP